MKDSGWGRKPPPHFFFYLFAGWAVGAHSTLHARSHDEAIMKV